MKFDKAIPILYSSDITKSLTYFTEQLKFDHKWEWNSPATFGCAYKDSVEIFFEKSDNEIPVIWIALLVNNVDEYYELIRDNGAKIISIPETKEWGIREMLVECPDGHIIRIGHNTACD